MGVKLVSSSAGSVELVAPVTASNYTATMPAKTGTVAMDGPAFSAYAGTGTHFNATVITKITVDVESFDTNNNFASSRFTPTVAGYYIFSGGWTAGTIYSDGSVYLYKNGTVAKAGSASGYSTNNSNGWVVSGILYMNGTTDYVELYGFSTLANDSTVGASFTYLDGCLIRGA